MATTPPPETFDVAEQLVRIQKQIVEISKIQQDMKLATSRTFFEGGLAVAALIGAGVAIAKLFAG